MKENNKILVISNGHGEDLISSKLIEALFKNSNSKDIEVDVFPFVGEGEDYINLDVRKIGPTVRLPSGGFARNSVTNLLKDIKAGLLSSTYKQIRTLRKAKNKYNLTIIVGDVYILLLTGLFKGGNIIFFPTAKSEYIDGHYEIEKYIIKRYTDIVIPRDEKTTRALKDYGINAEFHGNLMMDCFEIQNINFNLKEESEKIGILPGSRKDSYENMLDFIKVIEELEKLSDKKYDFLTAVAGNFSREKLIDKVKKLNWSSIKKEGENIKLQLNSPSGLSQIHIIYNAFGDVLNQAKIFLGMAGTANEQAAGMGKPVITFPGTGAQFDFEFAADQKRLLGEGVKFVDRNFKDIAYALIELLEDEKEYEKRSKAGQKRMGDRGAIDKISKLLLNSYLKSK